MSKKPAPKAKKATPAKPVPAKAAAKKVVAKAPAKVAAKAPAPVKKAPVPKVVKATAQAEAPQSAKKEDDEGYVAAKANLVKYLHGRRQAIFALARRYHLDAEDLQQDSYEVLLTCLRDFNPTHTRSTGEVVKVQFNTFFGNRLEGKALELRNRDPEYQARQAHMADMSDADKEQFRKDPPLLVQHLDQETSMQEHLRGEIASAKRANGTPLGLKVLRDGFMDKKLNELIAAERDDKRRAALLQVKVGGIASFDEIAYHFGVTDSRASQILNELMDAFYVQRLIDGDLKSVAYDFRKLKFQSKRANKLLAEALANSNPTRQQALLETFSADYPDMKTLPLTSAATSRPALQASASAFTPEPSGTPTPPSLRAWSDPFTADENTRYPARGLEWWNLADLTPLEVVFRPQAENPDAEAAHISQMMEHEPDSWPLIVTTQGWIIDGTRRWQAARRRGKDKMLCLVREVPTQAEAAILRVSSNLRSPRGDKSAPDKMDLFHAICALADLGLSQQKIADALGTSRPNVIVYAKVKDKATPKLRALFEDGLIQITNASGCVDLPAAGQDGIADFIRKFGSSWGKGPQFNEVFEAAVAGKLDSLSSSQASPLSVLPPSPSLPTSAPLQPHPANAPTAEVSEALKNRLSALETALRDAEAWNRQREATIARQTQELIDFKTKNDELARENDALALLQHADDSTLQGYLKEIKSFYTLAERLVSSAYQLEKASKSLRSQPLTHKQAHEVQTLLDAISSHLTSARVELVNQNRTTPSANPAKGLENPA